MDANDIASLLHVSVKTVRRIVKLFLNTGDVEPSSSKNSPDRVLSKFDELVLVQCVSEKPIVCICTSYKMSCSVPQVHGWIVLLYAEP